MQSKILFVLISLFLVAGCSGVSIAQEQGLDKTIFDGVYTKAQAVRGERTFRSDCQECHAPRTLRGMIQPASDKTTDQISGYYELIRLTMPYGVPGSLSDEAYQDVMAYILSVNEFPATDSE